MSDFLVRKGDAQPDMLNNCNTLYFEEAQLSYHVYRDSIVITLLDNALLTGKVCEKFKFVSAGQRNVDIINHLRRAIGGRDYTAQDLRAYVQSLAFGPVGQYLPAKLAVDDDITAYKEELQGIKVFSPFALSRLKPLTEKPAKWTMNHVRRALANKQFANLRCDGRYTDDYAHDAATNFSQGAFEALPFLKQLVERPSGWRTSIYDNSDTVDVSCHTFDNNSFRLVLTPPATVEKQPEEAVA